MCLAEVQIANAVVVKLKKCKLENSRNDVTIFGPGSKYQKSFFFENSYIYFTVFSAVIFMSNIGSLQKTAT